MFNFFAKEDMRNGDFYTLCGTDYNHIKNVLRMTVGDQFLISDNNESNLCEIKEITENEITAVIIKENYIDTSLDINIYLFEGLPKSDKLEFIIQKSVELGVCGIIPVEMEHCVVKLDDKKKKSKLARWQAISESAAKQSKRSFVPTVYEPTPFKKVLENIEKLDLFLVPFESKNGMTDTKNALLKLKKGMNVGILIGPEGGFSEKEINALIDKNCEIISLGKRILRTETAAICAVSMCMLYSETELSND